MIKSRWNRGNGIKAWGLCILLALLLLAAGCGGTSEAETGNDHGHEHGDTPYEWSGQIHLAANTYTLEFQESGDESCAIAFIKNEGDLHDLEHHAYHVMEAEMEAIEAGGHFTAVHEYGYVLGLNPDNTVITFTIEEEAEYLVFIEHMPEEFDLVLYDADGNALDFANTVTY